MATDVLGVYNRMLSGLGGNWIWFVYLIPVVILIIVLVSVTQGRKKYPYKVRVYRVRNNGSYKEKNFKGGYINRKGNAPFFRVKTGFWWWKVVDFIETPKIAYMDEEDRIYYKQIDVNTYIQCKREFDESNKIKFTPVESDVKYGAVLAIQRIKDVLRAESTFKKLLPYFGLVILAIAFIVAYALLIQGKCPA